MVAKPMSPVLTTGNPVVLGLEFIDLPAKVFELGFVVDFSYVRHPHEEDEELALLRVGELMKVGLSGPLTVGPAKPPHAAPRTYVGTWMIFVSFRHRV